MKTECVACPEHSVGGSSGSCQLCGDNYDRPAGQSSCKKCRDGFISLGGEACHDCSPGKYFFSTECVNCSPGRYGTVSHNGVQDCVTCPSGQYQDEKGQTGCKQLAGDESCQQGQIYIGVTNECVKCPVGRYIFQYFPARYWCIGCPTGKYQDLEGQTTCKQCSSADIGLYNEAGCTQQRDTVINECPYGTYTLRPNQNTCVECTGESTENGCFERNSNILVESGKTLMAYSSVSKFREP